MTPAAVLALLEGAITAGKALAEIIPWAQEQHPELRTEPWPDETTAMLDARAKAVARIEAAEADAAEVYDGEVRVVYVDGVSHAVAAPSLTYARILSLAGWTPDAVVSVMYRSGDSGGIVSPNGAVTAIDGMRISTSRTGAS